MRITTLIAACGLALATAWPAHAAISLAADGQWHEFDVDATVSASGGAEWVQTETLAADYGQPVAFAFDIAPGQVGTLTVVDAGFAGDRFQLTDHGKPLANTSAVPLQQVDSAPFEFEFSNALANPAFSRAVFTLGAGSHLVTGSLLQSVMQDATTPINATFGGLQLTVSAVPEPTTALLMFVGIAALASRKFPRNA